MRLRAQRDCSGFVVQNFELDDQVCARQETSSIFRPLGKLQTGTGKDVAKARVVPLARVAKAIEIKMPDGECGKLIALDDGIGRTLDAPANPQGVQQVARQCRFASAKVAAQFDEGVVQQRLRSKCRGKQPGRGFVGPVQAFYNGLVSQFVHQVNAGQWLPKIQAWARELGFSQIGVSSVDLSSSEAGLSAWLARGWHGDMNYMAAHGLKRARPAQLIPGTLSVITARMDYLPSGARCRVGRAIEFERLRRPHEGVVSVYARGRDYHKVLRSRLQQLAGRIATELGPLGHRAFTDSAPVLEAELATRSGQGWRGKHTLVLNREAGSMFFLGEIFVDVALPETPSQPAHCGSCQACIDVCPTQAIVAPYRLDARRCISYLTIEHAGAIPVELRPLLGNRIYGCDDCQLICPWNKYAQRSALPDFDERDGLVGGQLATLFGWSEAEFLRHTEGSPIRRIGHERWLRNIAVALGNALRAGHDPDLVRALAARAEHPGALVREHVTWALDF